MRGWRTLSYQENDGNVEQESNNSVGQQGPDTNVVNVAHSQIRHFNEQGSDTIHHSANRSEVVQGNERVHLEFSRAEKALNHDQTGGFENNTANLEQETDEDELDLTKRGNDDTDDNNSDVEEDFQVDGGHSHSPGSEQHSDRSCCLCTVISNYRQQNGKLIRAETHLQHLDKGNTQVQVCHITADQTQGEEKANRYNSAQVDPSSHLHSLAAIEQSCCAGENLSHESRECQVPCCQDDSWEVLDFVWRDLTTKKRLTEACTDKLLVGWMRKLDRLKRIGQISLTELGIIQDVLVEQDDAGTQSNPETNKASA